MPHVRSAAFGLAVLGLIHAAVAQGDPVPGAGGFPSHEFRGAGADAPAFRLVYDRTGASVRRIELLDHRAQADAPGPDDAAADRPYPLVIEELADPANPAAGAYGWLTLAARAGQAGLPAGLADLRDVPWEVSAERDVLRFRRDVGDGYRLEKTIHYDGEDRRDLRIELAIVAAADATARSGETWQFQLDGVGLRTPSDEALYGAAAMAVAHVLLPDGTAEFLPVREFGNPIRPSRPLVVAGQGTLDFAGTTNRFFGALLYPADAAAADALLDVRLATVPAREQARQKAWSVPVLEFGVALAVPAPGEATRRSFRLYLGPKSFEIWGRNAEYDRFDPVLEEALNPGCFCSVPGSKTLGGAMLWLLNQLHALVGSWGFAIVCLTILVRSLMFPLNFRMQKSMRAYGARMAKLKPKIDAIQQRYANDKPRLQQEMVALQREHKLFPPVGGCLPVFLTMPIYLGLFSAVRVAYELRLQGFLGVIDDLSSPDRLIPTGLGADSWLGAINLLPLLYMALMYYIVTRQPLPKDPQQRQVAQMMRYMPVIFGLLLYTYAAGMFVYMITSAAWTLVEQRVVKAVLGPVDPETAGLGGQPML